MNEREPYYEGVPIEERPLMTRNPVHVVLDNLRSAFNVGSIFRTSDAGAVEHLHLCGMSAHPPHKKIEKTSLGAFDYVPWTYYERTGDALQALESAGICRVAIEMTPGAASLTEYEWPERVAIVLGNEVTGINEKNLRKCDDIVRIPMLGHKNSLNVATAFGVVLFEVLRRWGRI